MAVDPATAKAVASLTRAKAQTKALGGKVGGKKPSTLSRIFDVISRPLYATAEPVARLAEGKSAGSAALGVLSGLAGKSKTDYGSVIERGHGGAFQSINKNKLAKSAISLGLDIALDPVTYLGGGVAKSIGKGTAEAAGLRAAQDVIEHSDSVERVLKAGAAARESAMEKKIVSAAKKGKEVTNTTKKADAAAQKAMKAEKEIIRDEARATVGKATTERLIAENPGKVQLKFAGKVIGESEKAYKGVANLGKIVGSTEAGKTLNEAFRTAAKFPERTNLIKRQAEIHGIEKGTESVKKMRDFFTPLTKDEKNMIPHLIEGRVDTAGLKTAGGEDLSKYVDEAKKLFKDMGDDEVAAKIFRKKGDVRPEEFLHDNYVHHVYEGGTKAQQKAFKNSRRKVVGSETPGFTMKRSMPTLKEAKAAGLKPVESIDDILATRLKKHYSSMARGHFVDGVSKEYGTQIGKLSKKERDRLAAEGYRPSKSLIQDKGVVFPEHIAKSLDVLEDMHNSDELYRKFVRVFDKVQGGWKFGATQLNPGHHIRNMIGDAWNGFVDGIDDPRYYEQAMRMGSKDKDLTIVLNGRRVNKSTLLELEAKYGAKSGFTPLELGEGAGPLRKVRAKANVIGEKRETYMRRAHFLGALQQEAKTAKSLDQAAEKAAARVRKWKIDYGDFTNFENNVMRRAIPFYSWTRKNIPLQIEALAMRPGRVAAIPKGQAAIQRIMGTDEGYNAPSSDTIPGWLREMAPIRLRGEGEGKNALYWNAPLPFQDIGKFTEGGQQGIMREVMSMISPIAKTPIEMATGRNLYTDIPYKGNLDFLSNLLPTTRLGRQAQTGNLKGVKLLNWLTGVGAQEVTPGQRQGELRNQQAELQKQIKALRAKASKGK